MAQIKRINPFNEIRKNEYHSVVIFGYSFDFHFFENVILKVLKRNSIANINVLIDSAIYEKTIKRFSTGNLPCNLGYHIEAYSENKVFHPKIIQFYGENKVLTFTGSGNPTSSGYGQNFELWFGIKSEESDTHDVKSFGLSTWDFIQKCSVNQSEIWNTKIDWIKKFTPSLNDNFTQQGFYPINEKEGLQAKAIPVMGTSILDQLGIKDQVQEIVICSPFFDVKMESIKKIQDQFPYLEKKTLIHDYYSNNNIALTEEIESLLDDWNKTPVNVVVNEFSEGNFLHAKFVYLKTQTSNYLVLGSSNCSLSGLGINKNNIEYNVVLYSKNTDFLKTIAVEIKPDAGIDFSKISKNTTVEPSTPSDSCSLLKILECSYLGNVLKLRINENCPANSLVIFENSLGESVEKMDIKDSHQKYTIEISKNIRCNAYTVCLANTAGQIISGRIHIVDKNQIYKCNPDPNNKKVFNILSKIENGDVEYFEVFNFLMTEFIDYKEPSRKHVGTQSKEFGEKDNEEGEKITLDYNKFKEETSRDTLLSRRIQRSLNLGDVFLCLSSLFSLGHNKQQDSNADMEENGVNLEQVDSCEDIIVQIKKSTHAKYSKSMIRFFDKLKKYISLKEKEKLNIYDLSLCLIAFQLMWATVERSIVVDGENVNLLDFCKQNDENGDDFKWIALTTCGSFLLKMANGIDDDNDPYCKERTGAILENIKNYLYLIIGAIATEEELYGKCYYELSWRRYIRIILLNFKQYFGGEFDYKIIDEVYRFSDIEKKLSLSLIKKTITKNLHFVEKYVISSFRVNSSVRPKDIIYSDFFGFLDVYKVIPDSKDNKTCMIFIHPGSNNWNNNDDCYLFKKKCAIIGKFFRVTSK